MNKRRNQGGFGLILLVMILSVVGMALMMLTLTGWTALQGSRQAQLDACSRNIQFSAEAWARKNSQSLQVGQSVHLDVRELGIEGASATLTPENIVAGKVQLQVEIHCHPKGGNLTKTMTLWVPK